MEQEHESEFIEDNTMILSKQTMDLFLEQENPLDLIALYLFYYYTAKWQKTNQPKCTDKYAMKGLHCGYGKLKKTKNKLIELNLIEKIVRRKNGKITGWYIKVYYIWKKETVKAKVSQVNQNTQNQDVVKPRCGNKTTNALSANSINALSANKEMLSANARKNSINKIITLFSGVNPSYKNLYKNKSERVAVSNLVIIMGEEKLKNTIRALPDIIVKKYAPRITTPCQLERKLGELITFYKQNNKSRGIKI